MRIIGTGSALPSKVIKNDMLSGFLDTGDDWIVPRTGIHSRRILTKESLSDLAAEASAKAIEAAGIEAASLDYILCSNVANEYVTPAMSAMVQGSVGATCPCLDVNGACAGFIYALDIAESYLQTGRAEKILVVCAEEPTRFVDWHQRETCVLFGDGAGAVVLSRGGEAVACRLAAVSDQKVICYRRCLESTPYQRRSDGDMPLVLQGREVFRKAVEASTYDIQWVLNRAGITPDEVDYFLLHQANKRIINSVRERLHQPEDKFPCNIADYGNTSSASIPILLDEMVRSGQIQPGKTLVFSAFGAGFVSGSTLIRY